jgi:hypothetical protein
MTKKKALSAHKIVPIPSKNMFAPEYLVYTIFIRLNDIPSSEMHQPTASGSASSSLA